MIKLNQNQYIELNNKYDEHYKKYDYQSYELAKDVYLFGAASRQGEVELLEKEIIETQEFLNKQNCIKQAKASELQKRIDQLQEANINLEGECVQKQKLIDELDARIKELELINFDSELHFDAAKEHIERLQKRIDDALNMLDSLQEQHWKKWKKGADMMDQGASNAYEQSYWILKGQNNG